MPAVTRKLSRLHKPPDLSLETWQRELRRQFGREQPFRLKNAGAEPVFSDFHVSNPRSGSVYRVAIRGPRPGDNYCSCPDFATNALGTCKHVEFVLRRLETRARTRVILQRGFQPPFSEIVLQYGAKRDVRFRPGTSCPHRLTALAAKYFDSQQILRAGAYAAFESFLSQAAKFDHDLRCCDDVLGFVAEVRDRSRREQRIAEAFPRVSAIPGCRRCSRASSTSISAKARSSRRGPVGVSLATRWASARRSRRSRRPRSWRVNSASSAC
jgi:SWIM zinc finger